MGNTVGTAGLAYPAEVLRVLPCAEVALLMILAERVWMASRRNIITCILASLLGIVAMTSYAAVFYVDPAGVGTQSGADWRNTLPTIQQGIDACYNAGGGEVWVRGGKYSGINESDVGESAVVLREGVSVYGGFGGWESYRNDRYWGGFKPSSLTLDPVPPFLILDRDQSSGTKTRCGYITGALNTFRIRNEYMGLSQGTNSDISKYTTCLIWRAYTYDSAARPWMSGSKLPAVCYVGSSGTARSDCKTGALSMVTKGDASHYYEFQWANGRKVYARGGAGCYVYNLDPNDPYVENLVFDSDGRSLMWRRNHQLEDPSKKPVVYCGAENLPMLITLELLKISGVPPRPLPFAICSDDAEDYKSLASDGLPALTEWCRAHGTIVINGLDSVERTMPADVKQHLIDNADVHKFIIHDHQGDYWENTSYTVDDVIAHHQARTAQLRALGFPMQDMGANGVYYTPMNGASLAGLQAMAKLGVRSLRAQTISTPQSPLYRRGINFTFKDTDGKVYQLTVVGEQHLDGAWDQTTLAQLEASIGATGDFNKFGNWIQATRLDFMIRGPDPLIQMHGINFNGGEYGDNPALTWIKLVDEFVANSGGWLKWADFDDLAYYQQGISNASVVDGAGDRGVVIDGASWENHASTAFDGFIVSGGVSDGNGAGLYINGANPSIGNCSFVNNRSADGGAVYLHDSSPVFSNCVFWNNTADFGGAIYSQDSLPSIRNCTFHGNRSTGGAGGALYGHGSGVLDVVNSVLWGDTASSDSEIHGSASVRFSNVQGGAEGPGNITADAMFVDGQTGDLRLRGESPSVDAGTTEGASDVDLDDRARPQGAFDMGAFETIAPMVTSGEPGALKRLATGRLARMPVAIVTAAFDGFFYIEDENRAGGIRVNWSGEVSVEDKVDVTGEIRTNSDGERYIKASSVIVSGSSPIKPVGMPNSRLGGADWLYEPITGSGQQGAGRKVGLNTIGLLVTTWGKVTNVAPGEFYINDGAKISDGSGAIGVKVLIDGPNPPAFGTTAVVTGVVSCYKSGGNTFACLRVRTQSDILE